MADITGEQVLAHEEKILQILDELPSSQEIEDCFHKMGCKTMIEELGISDDMIRLAMKYSPYVSHDITLLRLMKLFE